MNLRYTGAVAVTFMQLGRTVEPGEVFPVPDDDAPAYMDRTDVELVPDTPVRTRAKAATEPKPDDTVTA